MTWTWRWRPPQTISVPQALTIDPIWHRSNTFLTQIGRHFTGTHQLKRKISRFLKYLKSCTLDELYSPFKIVPDPARSPPHLPSPKTIPQGTPIWRPLELRLRLESAKGPGWKPAEGLTKQRESHMKCESSMTDNDHRIGLAKWKAEKILTEKWWVIFYLNLGNACLILDTLQRVLFAYIPPVMIKTQPLKLQKHGLSWSVCETLLQGKSKWVQWYKTTFC